MSVYIFQDNALDLLAKVEGENWYRKQLLLENPFGPVSFKANKEAWQQFYSSLKKQGHVSCESEVPTLFEPGGMYAGIDQGLSSEGDGIIYGDGGWTRYTVRCSGEIFLIAVQAPSQEIVEKAINAGFRLF